MSGEKGFFADAGWPSRITKKDQWQVTATVEANPEVSLPQITDTLTDLNICHTTL